MTKAKGSVLMVLVLILFSISTAIGIVTTSQLDLQYQSHHYFKSLQKYYKCLSGLIYAFQNREELPDLDLSSQVLTKVFTRRYGHIIPFLSESEASLYIFKSNQRLYAAYVMSSEKVSIYYSEILSKEGGVYMGKACLLKQVIE